MNEVQIYEAIQKQKKILDNIDKNMNKLKYYYDFNCELQSKYYSKTSPYQYQFLLNCKDSNLEKLIEMYYGKTKWLKLKSYFRLRNKKIIKYAKEIATKFEEVETISWLNTLKI